MSIVDKVLGAVTPPESDEKRAKATAKAREAAQGGEVFGRVGGQSSDNHGGKHLGQGRPEELQPKERSQKERGRGQILTASDLTL